VCEFNFSGLPRHLRQKKKIVFNICRPFLHDVFDIDNGDDYEDLVIIGEKT